MSYVTYHEPNLTQVLVLASFVYLANVARWAADKLLYAGLLGEIAVGIIFGKPLAGILDSAWEQTFLSLGYLGLLIIVFEGGLSTPLRTLLKSLPLATLIALTGIAAPIALSFLLVPIAKFDLLEAFAAGSSLSSTSLGTTFVVLKAVGGSGPKETEPSSPVEPESTDGVVSTVETPVAEAAAEAGGLEKTRLGTILAGAAVFDDVIGFVLSSVIKTVGENTTSSSDIEPWSIARPLVTSILFSALTPLVIKLILSPLYHRLLRPLIVRLPAHEQQLSLFLTILIFSGSLAITYVIGSSMLLGAYVAGLIVTSLDERDESMRRAFEDKIIPVQTYILSPIFFASIGTAIPFLSLWTGTVIWQGVVYSILMVFGKLVCGGWIILWGWGEDVKARRTEERTQVFIAERGVEMQDGPETITAEGSRPPSPTIDNTTTPPPPSDKEPAAGTDDSTPPPSDPEPVTNSTESSHQPPPQSIVTPSYSHVPPALFLGLALVARGEIGLLISQIAKSEAGLLGDEAFLVTTWAIVICTVVGPISVGLLVKRLGVEGVVRGRWI